MDQSKAKTHGAATARCGFIESSYRKDELYLLQPAEL